MTIITIGASYETTLGQVVIEHNGRRYVDVDHANRIADDANQCKALLRDARANMGQTVQIIERVRTEDKIIKEYIQVADVAARRKGRIEGAAVGGGLGVLGIIVLLLVIL